MKKLMTTVSAVALAFGLYATDTGTSFEGLGPGLNVGEKISYDINETTGELPTEATGDYWVTNDTATLDIVAGTSSLDEDNRPANFALQGNQRYLSIKTTLGNPVKRYVTRGGVATSLSGGDFYFDSLVKFTAFDEDPAIDLDGGKLAVWLKEVLDANDNPTATNLMVTAGFLDSENNAVVTNYECSVAGDLSGTTFNDGGWHRVTVKAINAIYNGSDIVNGFVVFIDGHRVKTSQPKGIDPTKLKDFAYFEHVDAEGALFPSAVQSGLEKSQIASVAFDGQGDVDDILFTSTAPSFAVTKDYFTINAGENVDSVDYAVAGEGGASGTVQAGSSAVVEYVASMSITITPHYSAGCAAGTWDGVQPTGSVVSPTAPGQYVTVIGATARATVSHNGVDTPYPTLKAAFDDINVGSGDYTVTLSGNVTENISLAQAGANVTLDLAGNTITGTGSGAAVIYVDQGTLLITNSSTVAIGHVVTNGEANAVFTYGAVAIAGGCFDGRVYADTTEGGSLAITGGAFEKASNGIGQGGNLAVATLPTNYEWVDGTGDLASYYVLAYVEPTPTYTVKYVYGLEQQSTNETANLKAGDPTPAAPVEAEITGYTLTWQPATNATVSADATYVAQYAANTYTISYELGGGTAGSGSAESYTYSAAAQTVTVVAPTYDGSISNFTGWTISPDTVTTNSNGTVNIPAGQTGDITLTANWEAAGSPYPSYIDDTDSKITGQYDTWKSTYSVADGDNAYEGDFLLNVAPGIVGATLEATAVSISGTTVAIDINHAVNGYAYVKKADTVAGLATATPTAVTVVPADNIENGARITLQNESGTAQFYQIGVQSAPVAVPNAD